IGTGPWPWNVSPTWARFRDPCTTCGPSLAVTSPGGRTVGDGSAAADPERLARGDVGPRRLLAHPANPAPVAAAPARRRNSRPPIGPCPTGLTPARARRPTHQPCPRTTARAVAL